MTLSQRDAVELLMQNLPPGQRAMPIHDDDLRSVLPAGSVVVIDTNDRRAREGYAALDIGGVKLFRIQFAGTGWIARTDHGAARSFSQREIEDIWLGRAVRVFINVQGGANA